MSELLSCPFCGGKAKLEHDTDGSVYIVLNHKDYCFLDGVDTLQWFYPFDGKTAEEVATESWNRRAERTCHIVPMDAAGNPPYRNGDLIMDSLSDGCSKCGCPFDTLNYGVPNYCPNCGAKVVE